MATEVIISIEACGERRLAIVDLEVREIAPFTERLLRAVGEAKEEARAETKSEDIRQSGLAREYRRGHRDGRQDAYSEVSKRER